MRLSVFKEFEGTSTFASLPSYIVPDIAMTDTVPAGAKPLKLEEQLVVQSNAKLFFTPDELSEVEAAIGALVALGYEVVERFPVTSPRPVEWPMKDRVILAYKARK